MQKYKINGWIDLIDKIPLIKGTDNIENIHVKNFITDSKKITIYLDTKRYATEEEKEYHKIYESNNGFTHFGILDLIQQTYWSAYKDIYINDSYSFSNLALHTFYFDPNTNSVYPNTDS
ncbi:hypothetical protein QJ854_gp304 [Moumouvirus goulette]|uniref:Uncharacterized protein n=1 Tax=Moumouvirus goulette TaxID=1247379 RepID=M1PHD0_9VIRU|nr:hypothetical protein QJ854_gp304 [Moumouvirus goulette]AGF85478.1 hypothetical protein glt_00670 [Moumouvirus goulette]